MRRSTYSRPTYVPSSLSYKSNRHHHPIASNQTRHHHQHTHTTTTNNNLLHGDDGEQGRPDLHGSDLSRYKMRTSPAHYRIDYCNTTLERNDESRKRFLVRSVWLLMLLLLTKAAPSTLRI